MKIAVYGMGVVGEAYASYIEQEHEIVRVDPYKGYDFTDEALFVDGVLVCVSAPTQEDGKVYIHDVANIIALYPHLPVMVKSTIPPEYAKTLPENVTFSPEFLRATSANEDVIYERNIILGGGDTQFWQSVFNTKIPHITTAYTASFMKYTINTYLATKVSFLNEINDTYDGDWNDLKKLLLTDERIGTSHMDIPGPDNQKGWGGLCFPKDTQAFVNQYDTLTVLQAAIESNNKYRS